MDFISIRVRKDNLMYLFFDDSYAFSVDAFSPNTILHALSCDLEKQNYTEMEILKLEKSKNRNLLYSFTSHGHFDHNGGDMELERLCPGVKMINFSNFEKFSCEIDQIFKFNVKCIKTPCHTLDSLCFLIKSQKMSYAVTGDFLFKLGCGKFFEGDADMFISSLDRLINSISKDTLLLYGHDYYETNKRFTEQFYKIDGCESFFLTLEEEQQFNVFINPMRVASIQGTRSERIKRLRDLKDNEFYLR